MFGEISRLSASDRLTNNIRSLRRRQPEFPDVIGRFALEVVGKGPGGFGNRIANGRRYAAISVPAETAWIQSAFAKNIGGTNHRILRIRACVSLKTKRLFEVESNDRGFCELQHEVTQRPDGNLGRNAGAFGLPQLRMSRIVFLASRRDESIEQVIRLDPKAFAARNLDPRPALIFIAKFVAQFRSAARSERDHLIRKMGIPIRSLVVPELAQSLDHRILSLRLPGIDYVVNLSHPAKMRMVFLPTGGRYPAIMSIRITIKSPIAEVAPQQPKLPHAVSDGLAHITNGSIRTDDDFLIFLGNRL